jgi:hypothetical protein
LPEQSPRRSGFVGKTEPFSDRPGAMVIVKTDDELASIFPHSRNCSSIVLDIGPPITFARQRTPQEGETPVMNFFNR